MYIVTGGAGFIGSHLVERLINNGREVLIIDDFSSGYKNNLPSSHIDRVINKKIQNISIEDIKNAEGIFHLAAQASVPVSIENFFESSSNNILGTLKVFSIAKEQNIPLVYASSSAVYGNLPMGDDQKESYEIISPYAQDKLTMEHYAAMMHNVFEVRSVGLRFFNVYGPRQDPTNPYSGVISIFIDRILNNSDIIINGGYQTRDFIYVSDIVEVLLASMKLLYERNIVDYINVGTGKSVSIDDLFLTLKSITKSSPKIVRKNLPKGDPEKSFGTYSKMKEILNIDINTFTDLHTGLVDTFEYFKNLNSK